MLYHGTVAVALDMHNIELSFTSLFIRVKSCYPCNIYISRRQNNSPNLLLPNNLAYTHSRYQALLMNPT